MAPCGRRPADAACPRRTTSAPSGSPGRCTARSWSTSPGLLSALRCSGPTRVPRSMRPRWDALPDEVLGRLGNPWSAGMTGPVLAWLAEHEPEAVARAERVALPKDLVREHLVSGSTSSDPSDASGTLLWDVAHGSWSREATALVPAHLLPKIRPSVEFVGTWRDAEVVVGGGDTPVSLVALEHAVDGWQPGDVVVNLGTGAQVIDPRTGPPTGSGWSDVHVYEGVLGDHYSMVAAQNAGLALSWAQQQLGITWDELSVDLPASPARGRVECCSARSSRPSAVPSRRRARDLDGSPRRWAAIRPPPWRHVRQPRRRPSWSDAPGSCSTWTRAGCSCWVVAHASPGCGSCWPTYSEGPSTTCPCAASRPPGQ